MEIDCSWPAPAAKSGISLTEYYVNMLLALGWQKDLLGAIFATAVSKFTNPVNLKKLIGVIDETEWTALHIDVKAAPFEGLLEKAASEGKKGAGQARGRRERHFLAAHVPASWKTNWPDASGEFPSPCDGTEYWNPALRLRRVDAGENSEHPTKECNLYRHPQ